MADIIVGSIFFAALGFAAKRIYNNFKSGSCNCGSEGSMRQCNATCSHCRF